MNGSTDETSDQGTAAQGGEHDRDQGRDQGRRRTKFADAVYSLAEYDVHTLLEVLPLPLPPRDPWVTARFELLHGDLPQPSIVAALPGLVVHGETVTIPEHDLALHMIASRLRLRRVHPNATIVQFLLLLRDDVDVAAAYQDPDGAMSASWTVVRVADLDAELLLQSPTTAPLAALAGYSGGRRD